MEQKELFENLLTGNCILFTGSGFSRGATNISDQNPKIGYSLTKELYTKCNIEDENPNLKVASEIFIEEFGEFKLIELLKNEFTIKEISENHKLLASLPWKRIYTTNYDNVIELAYKEKNKLITPITLNDKIDQYKDKRTLCIHLNGYIDRLTPNSLYKDFKLTDTSYLTEDFVKSKWVDLFRSDIETSSVILFVGFSLNEDLDLARIISAINKKNKIFFIVKPDETKLNLRRLSKFGTPLDIGTDGLVERIEHTKEYFTPPEFIKTNYISFIKSEIGDSVPRLKDIDTFELFFKGNVKKDLIHSSLIDSSKFKYYIKRHSIDEIFDYIKNGGRNILIHSDLGNGKTLFLHGLDDILTTNGYNVYWFKKYFDQTNDEIEQLCKTEQKTVLIFDSYGNHFDLLERLNLFRTKDIIVVASERTLVNDTVYSTLEDVLFHDTYLTKDLNKLNDIEVYILIDLLSSYGFWGKLTSESTRRKRDIITNELNSSFRLVLLRLLDSSDIKDRFNSILNNLRNINESFFDASLLILASSIFNFELDLDELVYILDDDLLNNPSFYNNDYLMEMIDFKEYTIKARSSILSESLLVKNIYHNELIKLFIKVVKKLDYKGYNKNNYRVIKSIVSFSRLQSIFNLNENHKFKPIILNFFEEIKNTYYAQNNPFFWLQYAIARLSTRDYDISQKYFETAYGLAKKKEDFDTFQIDNHYARQILENEVYNGDETTCMEQFLKAHDMIMQNSSSNKNKHYPFRVASNYGKFYDKYFDKLKNQDQIIFLRSCEDVLNKISDYKKVVDKYRWNNAILICEQEMNRVLNK